MAMTSERPKKVGGACERVWAIADELANESDAEPRLSQIRERYVAEGGNPNTAATQFSLWLREYRHRPTASNRAYQARIPDSPVKLTVAGDGRVVIPKEFREAMELGDDGEVSARLVDGELRLVSPRTSLRHAQRALAPLKREGESIVDEFIASRRAMWGEE